MIFDIYLGFFLIKGSALNSPAKRRLNAKIEMAKIVVFLGRPFCLILSDSSCPFVHLSTHLTSIG